MNLKNVLLTAVATLGLAAVTIAQNVPSYVPTNGLVGWWPFNGNANDESGNNNNGTVNGASLTADRFGSANKAYKFDGLNDKIVTNRAFHSTLSASIWTKIDTLCSYTPFIDGNFESWELVSDGPGKLLSLVIFNGNNSYVEYPTNYTLTTNDLNHFVLIYTPNNATIYVNGTIITTFSTIPINNSTGFYYFGDSNSGSDQWLNGKLDDIGIWNRALTQQEITALYTGNGVGLKESSNITSINIQPNPAQTQLHVSNATKGSKLIVLDAQGRQVYEILLNESEFTIPLENWARGIYTLCQPQTGLNYRFVKE